MDTYVYRCGDREHRLSVSTYDSHLLVLVNQFPPWRAGILASPGQGQVRHIPTRDLRDDALALVGRLDRDGPLLQFRYSLKVRSSDGAVQERGGGRLLCAVGGTPVLAKAGPGFCALTTSSTIMLDESTSERLVQELAMRQDEAARLAGMAPTTVQAAVVHDLRDMRPIRLDDGRSLQAERRSHRTDIAADVRLLVEYLSRLSGDVVEVSVEEGRG
jgi:predicted DNA-binding protein (UPF0251 family)